MKFLSVFIFISFISPSLISQITEGSNFDKVIFENTEIQIQSKFENCNNPSEGLDRDYVILSIRNYKDYDIYLEFDQELYYDGICKTCDKIEYHFVFQLGPNEVISGKCPFGGLAGLRIFHGMPEKWLKEKLSDFKLSNIITKRI